jgi:hypothetical protein
VQKGCRQQAGDAAILDELAMIEKKVVVTIPSRGFSGMSYGPGLRLFSQNSYLKCGDFEYTYILIDVILLSLKEMRKHHGCRST